MPAWLCECTIRHYVHAGCIRDAGPVRPAIRGTGGADMTAAYPALAIDIGGTKFAAGLVEPGGRVISWSQTATPRELDEEQLLRTLDALVSRVLTASEVYLSTEYVGGGRRLWGP